MSKIQITQKRSLISEPESVRKVMAGLGLKRIGQTVIQKDNNCIRGMVNKVRHLVSFKLGE
jgi:large subunit ribosomal protein L30